VTGELGVVSVSQAYDGAEGGIASWRLRCCGRHFVGLEYVVIVLWCCIRAKRDGGERLRALSLCRVYKAVALDCWSSLGAVVMISVACTRSTRPDKCFCGHT
jgi:hypothetical protein